MDASTSPRLSTLPTAGAAEAKATGIGYYGICGLGGALSFGLTHFLAHPHEHVACSMQIDPAKYASAYRTTKGLFSSAFPRAIGYSIKGLVFLPLYEIGLELNTSISGAARPAMLASLAVSTVFIANFASIFPTPPKILSGGSSRLFQDWINIQGRIMAKNRCRLATHSMIQFPLYELTTDATYRYIKPKADCRESEQLAITLAAGYIAGIACAVATHPAEKLVYEGLDNLGLVKGAKQLGYRGLWAGIGPRSFMLGTIAALQWSIYDGVKNAMYTPPTEPHTMPESLRKKLEEAKEQKPNQSIDLQPYSD